MSQRRRAKTAHETLGSSGTGTALKLLVTLHVLSGCLGPLGPTAAVRNGNGSSLANCKTFSLASAKATSEAGPRLQLLAGVYYNGTGGVQQMVAAKCATAGCHVANAQAPNLSTADLLKTNYTRFLARSKDTANIMPPASSGKTRFSAAELASLDTWKTDGFPLDASAPTATPTPTSAPSSGGKPAANGTTFKKDVLPYLEQKCMSCHKVTPPKELNQYSYMKDNIVTVLDLMRSDGADVMPKGGKDAAGVALLESWQAGGMIEGTASSASSASAEPAEGECKLEDLPAAQKEKYLEMVSPKELKACNEDKKQVYSRVSKKCVGDSEILPAATCNLEWAKARIDSSKDDVKKKFADQIEKGYVIEQCGSSGGDSLFYMTKFDYGTMTVTTSSGYRVTAP